MSGSRDVVVSEVVRPTVVVDDACAVVLVAPAAQGPAGRQGVPGPAGGSAFQRTAGETISALHAVYELNDQVFTLGSSDEDHVSLLLGVATTAAGPGDDINIQRSGAIDEPSWSWTPGPVWLSPTGTLTQTPPSDGFDVLIGAAVSPTRVILDLQTPIDLQE